MSRKRTRWWRLLVPVAVAAAVGTALAWQTLRPKEVVAVRVVRGTAIDAVYATGTVEAEERVLVRAKSAGSIVELLADEGQAVKKGDLLARIDNPAAASELKRGQAELSAAAAQAGPTAPQIEALRARARALAAELDTAKLELARSEKLLASGARAASEVDWARMRVQQLEQSIGANEAEQRAMRIELSANRARSAAQVESLASRVVDTEVRAPLDGIVLSRSVEVGEVVTLNQPLFKVGDTRKLVLELSVDEADVARVHDGTGEPASRAAVSLYAFPKQVFRAAVFEIQPEADRARKAFTVKLRFDEPPRGLRSGMSAEANIIARERDGALLAPADAENNGFVWRVEEGRARRVAVTVGLRDLVRIEVLEGLEEGELVILAGADTIAENGRVRVTERALDGLAPSAGSAKVSHTTLK